jgi:hypothetical protein
VKQSIGAIVCIAALAAASVFATRFVIAQQRPKAKPSAAPARNMPAPDTGLGLSHRIEVDSAGHAAGGVELIVDWSISRGARYRGPARGLSDRAQVVAEVFAPGDARLEEVLETFEGGPVAVRPGESRYRVPVSIRLQPNAEPYRVRVGVREVDESGRVHQDGSVAIGPQWCTYRVVQFKVD